MDLIMLLVDRSFKHREFVFHKPSKRLCRVFEPQRHIGTSYVFLNNEVTVSFIGDNTVDFIPAKELTHVYSWREWPRAIEYCSRKHLSAVAYVFNLFCFMLSTVVATETKWSAYVVIPLLVYAMLIAFDDDQEFLKPVYTFTYAALVLALTITVCRWS
jgi:hypothetical protein